MHTGLLALLLDSLPSGWTSFELFRMWSCLINELSWNSLTFRGLSHGILQADPWRGQSLLSWSPGCGLMVTAAFDFPLPSEPLLVCECKVQQSICLHWLLHQLCQEVPQTLTALLTTCWVVSPANNQAAPPWMLFLLACKSLTHLFCRVAYSRHSLVCSLILSHKFSRALFPAYHP